MKSERIENLKICHTYSLVVNYLKIENKRSCFFFFIFFFLYIQFYKRRMKNTFCVLFLSQIECERERDGWETGNWGVERKGIQVAEKNQPLWMSVPIMQFLCQFHFLLLSSSPQSMLLLLLVVFSYFLKFNANVLDCWSVNSDCCTYLYMRVDVNPLTFSMSFTRNEMKRFGVFATFLHRIWISYVQFACKINVQKRWRVKNALMRISERDGQKKNCWNHWNIFWRAYGFGMSRGKWLKTTNICTFNAIFIA